MAEYYVGTSDITGTIYAGRAKKQGNMSEWIAKSDVTEEALHAVVAHMLYKAEKNSDFAYAFKLFDGRYVRLRLEVSDTKPEWLDG